MTTLEHRVAARYLKAGFIPDKFFKTYASEMKRLLGKPVKSPWDVFEATVDVIDLYEKFLKDVKSFGLNRHAEASLTERVKTVQFQLDKIHEAYGNLDSDLQSWTYPPRATEHVIEQYICAQLSSAFEAKFKTLGSALKTIWRVSIQDIRDLAKKAAKKATPEEQAALLDQDNFTSRVLDIKYKFLDRSVGRAIPRLVKKEKVDRDFVGWFDMARRVLELNFTQDSLEDVDGFDEFSLGRLKAVVVDTSLDQYGIKPYVKKLTEARALLRNKGFEKVWYGVLFIRGQYNRLTPEQQEAYAQLGYHGLESQAGTYHSGQDIVRIMAPSRSNLVETVVHEMGHRYWFKFMKPGQRARFNSLVKTNPSDRVRDFPSGPTDEGGREKPVAPVSDYGKSSIEEAFAEAFTHYVLGKDMDRDQVESFRSVLATEDRVSQRYLTAAYSNDTLDVVLAGMGLLLMQSVIVSNEFFSRTEIKRYLDVRRIFHNTFAEACEDLAEEIEKGTFGEGAKLAVSPLQRVGAIPPKQARRALRLSARALRSLKRMQLQGDPRLRRIIFLAAQVAADAQKDTTDMPQEFVRGILRNAAVPAQVRTILRKALKFMRRGTQFNETANPGAWFEMSEDVQAKLQKELFRLKDEQDRVYEEVKDPEERSKAYRALLQKIERIQNAAGVNLSIVQAGPKENLPSLDSVLAKESKQLPDGPTDFVITKFVAKIEEHLGKDGALPRPLRTMVTQLKKARQYDTIRRVLQEAIERKLIYKEWLETAENLMAQAERNIAVRKGVPLTPLQWSPISVENFQKKHATGRVVFDDNIPEKKQTEILGRVSRALEDLEGIFGKGFAGRHDKPLEFRFQGASGFAAASYFGWDDRNNWQPRVKFSEEYEGLLAHELSHFFDDLLANKLDSVLYPERQKHGPGSRDLFGSTGVSLEYSAKIVSRYDEILPELGEFVRAVLNTPDYSRWADMTGLAHEIGVSKAIETLTGVGAYDLPSDHPYYRYVLDPPRFKSEWDPDLLAETEKAYIQMMGGDKRKLTYYNSGVEVWARMVEQYVATKLADAGIANPWLTQLSYDTQDLPQMMEQKTFEEKVVPILDRLFATLKDRTLVAARRVAARYRLRQDPCKPFVTTPRCGPR